MLQRSLIPAKNPAGIGFAQLRIHSHCLRLKETLCLKETMSQNYQPGQLVRLARIGPPKFDANSSDVYEVLRLMPADQTGDVIYRVKSLNAGERAVRKGEMIPYVPEN